MTVAYRAPDSRKPAMHKHFFSKQICLKNEEIHCITNEGKMMRNEWENDDSNFLRALHSVYKKIRTIFFHTLLAIQSSIACYKYFKS